MNLIFTRIKNRLTMPAAILSLKIISAILILTVQALNSSAQTDSSRLLIRNFIVKENLLKNEKIAIIACDEQEKPLENVSGTFRFSINGFKQDLRFNDGVAVTPQPIDKSTFLYVRHTNETGTYGKLYYVIKKETDLNFIKINWLLLLLIPLGIIFIAMIFRKFLLIAILLLAALFYFNADKGLALPDFFTMIFDGLKSLF